MGRGRWRERGRKEIAICRKCQYHDADLGYREEIQAQKLLCINLRVVWKDAGRCYKQQEVAKTGKRAGEKESTDFSEPSLEPENYYQPFSFLL